MGGRGGNSGLQTNGITGLSVTFNGETTKYFFSKYNGQNFYQRDIGGIPEPTPQNMSAKEFEMRVLNNGAKTEKISKSEINKLERERNKDKEETDKFLNEQWYKAGPKKRKGWKGH
jgi:hypothetical protein